MRRCQDAEAGLAHERPFHQKAAFIHGDVRADRHRDLVGAFVDVDHLAEAQGLTRRPNLAKRARDRRRRGNQGFPQAEDEASVVEAEGNPVPQVLRNPGPEIGVQRLAAARGQPDEQALVQESYELPPDAGIRPQVPGMREAAGSVEIKDDGPDRDLADVLTPTL